MMILVGIAAFAAVCLINRNNRQGAGRLNKAQMHGYEHRARCEELFPLDYLSR